MIDIHTHTIYSDGKHSAAHLLQNACAHSLAVFSVSDHNTVGAYPEIMKNRNLFSGKILPAVELSCLYKSNAIEVLGYGIDIEGMRAEIENRALSGDECFCRNIRNDVSSLLEHGVVLDKDFIDEALLRTDEFLEKSKQYNGGSRMRMLENMRRHIQNARFFRSEDEFMTCSRHVFFRNYLNNTKSTLFVDRSSLLPSLEQTVDIIHKCGGKAFLAHIYSYCDEVVRSFEDIAQNYNLDGIECHYGTFTKEQKNTLCDYCEKHNLFMSGGSDFHGYKMRPENIFGKSAGEPIPLELITPWLDLVKDSLI